MSETEISPGGETVTPDTDEGGSGSGDQTNSLGSKDAAELVDIIRGMRKESAKYRTRAGAAEEKLTSATSELDDLTARLTELESQSKTAEEQDAERMATLEARASLVETLEPYQRHVKSQYESGVSDVDALADEDQKARFTELLESFPENDYLGRLRALRALQVVQPISKGQMDPGDQGNPGEPGGGASETSLADRLGWSGDGLKEARLAGLIK